MDLQEAIQVIKDHLRIGAGLYTAWYQAVNHSAIEAAEHSGVNKDVAIAIGDKTAKNFLARLTSHDFVDSEPASAQEASEKTFEYQVTDQDLKNNPQLSDAGVVAGEIIDLPLDATMPPVVTVTPLRPGGKGKLSDN